MVEVPGSRGDDSDALSARLASSLGRTTPKSPTEALRPQAVPPPPVRSRAARHPVVVILNFGVTAVIAAGLLVGGAILAARYQFEQNGGFDDAHTVTVKPGATADDVADLLQREGVGNRWVFIAGVRFAGEAGNLKAGEYLVPAHASLSDIMHSMTAGRVIVHSITIAEGLTSRQIVDCLMADTVLVDGYTSGLTARQIDACRRDTAGLSGTIANLPPEGALLPETYAFGRDDTRQSIIDRMTRDRQRVVDDIWARRAKDLPLKTPADLVTLASIIEKETSLSDERSRVSAVYVNRLRINMKLDADPTVTYAIFKGAAPPPGYRLSSADKQAASPYNTYASPGLPPGPIANPGRAALEAAANPSRTKDLYFVADGNGGHLFAETFEEHQRNVARYRQANTAVTATPVAAPVAAPSQTAPAAETLAPPPSSAPRTPGGPPAPVPRPSTARP